MAQTPPPPNATATYAIPMPPLPSRGHQHQGRSHHPRHSVLSQSFSLGPESLLATTSNGPGSLLMPGTGATGRELQYHHSDPNASIMAASPRTRRVRPAVFDGSRGRPSLLSGASQSSQFPGTLAPAQQLPTNDQDQSITETQPATELGELTNEDWGIVDRMRMWRHDAIMQHLHDSAVFWGDKVLSWTADPNDGFWLAQAHFLNQQYARAEQLLTRPFVVPRRQRQLSKGKEREMADTSGAVMVDLDSPAREQTYGVNILTPDAPAGTVSKLIDLSVQCRYLAAQCMIRSGKWAEALETLGETNPWRGTGKSGPAIPNPDGGIKVEASMCYLRGVLMTRLNRQDRAKEHFMEALALDVKCFDAFHELVNGNLLSIDEEWDFVQGLQFQQQVPEDAEFVRLVYSIRLKKEKHVQEMALARQRLIEEYGMDENPDVMFSFAESMYAQYRWEDAFTITSRIQDLVGIHPLSLPIHIACMHNLRHLHPRLFLLAHNLVDQDPEMPVSWYAVGVYYMMTKKYLDARKFFSKANLMDPRFGAAWIGFAHSYSYEGEHDHAIVAYSTAARLFPGMHLPALFLSMEYLQINNLPLAEEYLQMALSVCDSDPLLYSEWGVLAFESGKYEEAARHLEKAIELVSHVQGTDAIWAATYLNLGQAYRKLKRYEDARAAFQRVVLLNPRHAQGYACLGIISHVQGEYDKAIQYYHESLSIEPLETNVIDLLNMVLDYNMDLPPENLGIVGLPGGEEHWQQTVAARQSLYEKPPPPPVDQADLSLDQPEEQPSFDASSMDTSAMDMA